MIRPPNDDPQSWEEVTDAEQAFTMPFPRGWQNRAWVDRRGSIPTTLATSTDGVTTLFLGDARLPQFIDPGAFPAEGMVPRPFVSIEHFLPDYARDRFGRLDGFAIRDMRPSPQFHQSMLHKLVSSGAQQVGVTAARLEFELAGGLCGVLLGSTYNLWPIWMVEVLGVVCPGDTGGFEAALLGMFAARRATPAMHQRQMAERAASAARHAATMQSLEQNAAILRANHRQSMATLDGMAAAHHDRMDALHASHDAANAAWQDRQAAPVPTETDDSHRRFLNLIVEERTVVDGEGNSFQVADGYDRYFRRRSDNKWIGTGSHQDLSDIPGVDPDEFEEMHIKR